jgi:hypothetical protein
MAQTIEVAVRHDALLKICALDTGRHTNEQLAAVRVRQTDTLRAAVTERHDPDFLRQFHEIAAAWEALSNPLAAQVYATVHVVDQVLAEAPTYYAQRDPTERGSFL